MSYKTSETKSENLIARNTKSKTYSIKFNDLMARLRVAARTQYHIKGDQIRSL